VVLKERGVRDSARAEGRLLDGALPAAPDDDPFAERPGRLVVREHGLRFGIDLLYGQNTGLFLDARPMRAWVRAHAAERGVLNLFSYTSAFGVAAMAGGANYVTNVDLVPSALERGAANYQLNGFDPSRAHVRSDVFAFLKRQAGGTRRFGGVISDPPPVPTRKRGKRGRRDRGFSPRSDMRKLLEQAAALREPGGWLLALSAARHRDLFEEQLPDGDWTRIARGADHPGEPDDGVRGWIDGA
jgi:23S rRNA G2069 N7-methylase RlmK/C1962 C5-methylase RlmI